MNDQAGTNQGLLEEISALKQEIQELKKSEEESKWAVDALRKSNELLLEMTNQVPGVVYQFYAKSNGALGFNYVSERSEEIFGVKADLEGYFERFASMIIPEHRDSAIKSVEQAVKEASVWEYEGMIQKPSGEKIWVSGHSTPSRRENEIVFNGILTDITERKHAEEALRKSEEKYREIFENAVEGICQTTPERGFLSVNPAFVRILGYESPAELMGAISDIVNQLFVDPTRAQVTRRLLSEYGIAKDIEAQLYRKDKSMIWVEITLHAVRDQEGNIINYQGIIMDVTEKKRLESALLSAQKLKSLGTLAGGIAHDFNNLLMGIQGYASLMLLNMPPSHPHHGYLKTIEEQVASGADLTRQLLGFARGGRYEIKPTNMNDIIQKTSTMFGRTKKEITIYPKYSKELWTVEVDRGQMEQVFMNLYVNAWQAMPGGGELYLETENVLVNDGKAFPYEFKAGKYVKITCTDTGTGMDEKTKAQIFDPFFTTKVMGRGTGLGLATVYGIIKGHKGMINVYSEPDHGTTFTVYLPASEKEIVTEKAVEDTALRGTETILLVDDEKIVLEVSKQLLEFLGYRVYIAASGQKAIDLYMEKRNQIDLVILDMIMPGISGGETFDRLREIDPELRILLCSGYSINGEAQQILDRGCNGFIQKPFQLKILAQSIRKILD